MESMVKKKVVPQATIYTIHEYTRKFSSQIDNYALTSAWVPFTSHSQKMQNGFMKCGKRPNHK